MNRFVLDASVALAWFLDNPVADLAVQVRASLENGSHALVPALWHSEIANGFVIAERRGALTASFTDRCLDDIERLMSSVIETSASVISLRQAFASGRSFRLSAYDAIYLETARREHLPLATLDHALSVAAAKAGVALFG